MKENSPYLINTYQNSSMMADKDDLFFQRQKERTFHSINRISEDELLNQMMSIDPDDELQKENVIKQINDFYKTKSIQNYHDIKKVRDFLLNMMYRESPPHKKYGLRCFIEIFCQKTFIFEYYFAETFLVVLKDNFISDDLTVILYTLQIAAKIASVSKKIARLAHKHITPNYLVEIIKNDDFDESIAEKVICIKEKALCILGYYCFSLITIDEQFIDMICDLAITLFQNPKSEKLYQPIIYCCALIARKVDGFQLYYRKYSLFQIFNQMLYQTDSFHTQQLILKIAKYLYRYTKDSILISKDEIDLNAIFKLMNHPSSIIQPYAVKCISEVVQSSQEVLESLIKMGLFQNIASIFENGSHFAKIKTIKLLSLLLQIDPEKMTQTFIENDYVNFLMNLIETTFDNIKSLSILLTILIEMNKIMKNRGNGDEFEKIIKSCRSCEQLIELVDCSNDASDLAELLASEINL